MHNGGWLIDESSLALLLEEIANTNSEVSLESQEEFTSTQLESRNVNKVVEIFVFNREYLDAKIDTIREELRIEIEPGLINSALPGSLTFLRLLENILSDAVQITNRVLLKPISTLY